MAAQLEVVLVQIEQHGVHLVLCELQRVLVEPPNAVEGADAHLIDLVVQHVNEKALYRRSNRDALDSEEAHGSYAGETHSHGVVLEQEQQDALDV